MVDLLADQRHLTKRLIHRIPHHRLALIGDLLWRAQMIVVHVVHRLFGRIGVVHQRDLLTVDVYIFPQGSSRAGIDLRNHLTGLIVEEVHRGSRVAVHRFGNALPLSIVQALNGLPLSADTCVAGRGASDRCGG